MKRVLLSLLALLLCAALVGCGKNTDSDAPAGMQLASSEDADYLFYVPETWRVDKSTLYSAAYYSSGDATSISVTAYGMDFTEVSVADWWEGFAEKFSATFETMEVTATEDATLGGADAVKYSFDATIAGGSYRYIVVAALRSNYVYYITYTSTPEFYEEHLEALDQVIENFAFK